MRTVKELYDLINKQYQAREVFPHLPAIKVNCYNALEVRAIRKAILELDPQLGFTGPDCFMVGDSLLTTHLGKESTKLESIEEQESFLNVMLCKTSLAADRCCCDNSLHKYYSATCIKNVPNISKS